MRSSVNLRPVNTRRLASVLQDPESTQLRGAQNGHALQPKCALHHKIAIGYAEIPGKRVKNCLIDSDHITARGE
jgi:hypothetical protein